MAARDRILGSYEEAKANNPELTQSEFMLAANPGPHEVKVRKPLFDREGNRVMDDRGKPAWIERPYYSHYSNAGSAGRAFRKLDSGETSGERIEKRGRLFQYPAGEGQHGFKLAPPKGGHQIGLWKVIVHFSYTDSNGVDHEDVQRSFIATSEEYESLYDIPAIEGRLNTAVEDHLDEWINDEGSDKDADPSTVRGIYIEIIKIQTTRTTSEYQVVME